MTSIDLEPDMWFEIADTLKQVLSNMEKLLTNPNYRIEPANRAINERKYQYLKTISETLESKLTK